MTKKTYECREGLFSKLSLREKNAFRIGARRSPARAVERFREKPKGLRRLIARNLGTALLFLPAYIFAGPAMAVTPEFTITIEDLTTGNPITQAQIIKAGDQFQVTVHSASVPCAGQWAVSALGAPGYAPEVLVQVVPFILGSTVSTDSASGSILTANPLVSMDSIKENDWKISASCNGPLHGQIYTAHLEFFVRP